MWEIHRPLRAAVYDPSVVLDRFSWSAVPSSGYLPHGQEVTVRFVGTPAPPKNLALPSAVYNGKVFAEFDVVWWTGESISPRVTTGRRSRRCSTIAHMVRTGAARAVYLARRSWIARKTAMRRSTVRGPCYVAYIVAGKR